MASQQNMLRYDTWGNLAKELSRFHVYFILLFVNFAVHHHPIEIFFFIALEGRKKRNRQYDTIVGGEAPNKYLSKSNIKSPFKSNTE